MAGWPLSQDSLQTLTLQEFPSTWQGRARKDPQEISGDDRSQVLDTLDIPATKHDS